MDQMYSTLIPKKTIIDSLSYQQTNKCRGGFRNDFLVRQIRIKTRTSTNLNDSIQFWQDFGTSQAVSDVV